MLKLYKHSFLLAISFIMLFPFVFVFIGATNDSNWAFTDFLILDIGEFFFENLKTVLVRYNIINALLVTLMVATTTTFISLAILSIAAYVFCKFKFVGKNMLQSIFISLVLIPHPAYVIGQLETISFLQMYSTFFGLVLPFIINLRVLLYLQGVMKIISDNMLDAARIDGASELHIMARIALPSVFDKIILAAFMIFAASWNNFLIPMIITNNSTLFTLPILISAIADPLTYDIGAVFMALLFSITPIILLFGFVQTIIFKKYN